MRKLLFSITSLILFVVAISSCSNTKTYAEKLADEKNAIAKLLADSFVVIPFNVDSLYTPQNRHIMQLDGKGLYMAIISKGDMDNKAVANATTVNYRFKGLWVMSEDTTYSLESSTYPFKLKFGQGATSLSDYTQACDGIQRPLNFLGDGAKVKLIIPSKLSFTNYQSSVTPLYFREVTYTFSLQD